MRARVIAASSLLLPLIFSVASPSRAQRPKKDYLSETEADKIRDAETNSERVKLFLSFAADRLKKFDYELHRTTPNPRRAEMLNALLNAYGGCIDDAADRIAEARQSTEDIREGLKAMKTKGKEFLDELEKISASGPDKEPYADTLNDAIEATRDALDEAETAAKEMPAPPTRRKP